MPNPVQELNSVQVNDTANDFPNPSRMTFVRQESSEGDSSEEDSATCAPNVDKDCPTENGAVQVQNTPEFPDPFISDASLNLGSDTGRPCTLCDELCICNKDGMESSWRRVRSRRGRRRRSLQGAHFNTPKRYVSVEDVHASESEADIMVKLPRAIDPGELLPSAIKYGGALVNPDLWRYRVPSMCLTENATGLSRIDLITRGWQEMVRREEADWRDGKAMRKWHAIRKENALWRLWHLERERQVQGLPARGSLIDDLKGLSCWKCAQGLNIGKPCECGMKHFDQHCGFLTKSGSSTDVPSSSFESTEDRFEEDHFLAEVFAHSAAPYRIEEDDDDSETSWRHLLYGPPPLTMSSMSSLVRFQNISWTRWQDKQRSMNLIPDPPMLTFPPTPSDSEPGSPELSARRAVAFNAVGPLPSDSSHYPLPFSAVVATYCPAVTFTVPLHIAPQVQKYIESLLAPGEDKPQVG